MLCPPRVYFPGGSQSFSQIPGSGNVLWALELLQQGENFFGIFVLQFVGCLLGSSMLALEATSSRRTMLLPPEPLPPGRSLPTIALQETLKHRPGSVSCGVTAPFLWSWCTQGCVCAPQASLAGLRFDFKRDGAPPTILLGLLLCPWMWGIFFGWDPTFSC